MSLTKTVPVPVPSLFHSSRPCDPSSAEKYTTPFTFVSQLGFDELLPLVLMSRTRTVPAAVPSLFHNSRPSVPSSATKNRVPCTLVRLFGTELLIVVTLY